MNHRTTAAMAAALVATSALALTGCAGGGGADDQVLRIAMGSPGEAQIRVWEDVAEQFESEHEGWTIELNFQQDDMYQTIGLPNLLSGRNAPDIYFEWVGNRLAERTAEGHAAELDELVASGPLAGVLPENAYASATADGAIRLVPHIADVSNVIWYNVDVLEEHGITPPETWEDLLAACDTLGEAGLIPIASGNKDFWAAGNWLGHVVSRVVGAEAYDAALNGDESFDTPEWREAFGYIEELHAHGCVNESANAIDDNEGAQLFFQEKAAMHAIGSWLVSWAIDEAPDLDFDFVNLQAMPGEVEPGSVEGVVTGYVINAESSEEKVELAAEFLALLHSTQNAEAFIEAEAVPVSATDSTAIDERTGRLNTLLSEASVVVSPADTGYDLETADAFYRALAEVLDGRTSAEDAVANLAEQVG